MLGGSTSSNLLKVLMYLMVLFVGPCTSVVQTNKTACRLKTIKAVEEYEYIKEGDIMIGGVLTVSASAGVELKRLQVECIRPSVQKYQYLVEFIYLLKVINDDQLNLNNVTLGYHILDSCGYPLWALRSVLQILSGTREPVPNYSCVGKRKIAGFIGDLNSDPTISMAHILGTLGYSQISYGATDPSLSDRVMFPYFFRTVQNDEEECIALAKLLKYFGWNWIGMIYFDDYSGYRDHQLLIKSLSREGICVEFSAKLGYRDILRTRYMIKQSSSDVILICGEVNFAHSSSLFMLHGLVKKTCIFLSKFLNNFEELNDYEDLFSHGKLLSGSLTFMQNRFYDPSDYQFREFSDSMHPSKYPEENLLENIWIRYFSCLSKKKKQKMHTINSPYYGGPYNCSGKEKLTDIPNYFGLYHSESLINAVDIMNIALQDMQTSVKHRPMPNYNYQLHRFLRSVSYSMDRSPKASFNEKGELPNKYEISNPQLGPLDEWSWNIVGHYVPWAPLEQRLTLNPSKIIWKTPNKVPRAQYSDSCVPGYRKATKSGIFPCYYDCVPCPEGEISNTTDSEMCFRCPDLEWPNEKKNTCLARTEEFLTYNNDVISVFFSSFSVLFFILTVLILGVFITHWDTPIVRANNRSLSFLLLVSIKLSFLSVFLFLGRPVDITCMLRNITFGITFSIAVSSLLAKTIMVCVAFKATKPGSSWRKWVGVKLSNSVVLFCSSIQIIICMTWLAISPPFQELDLHTYPGTIIIQCNEGSAIGFYSVIGYMGLLAAVSFVLAFLARTLPDSFNEAKYITFSMLLFCSVWITMIPAYLSTKGKNTVCVEIFAILTSSAGLLACIFLPKCYTILFRPEMNTKTHLLVNKP
ncbi:hypothetical protein XELAEV_18008690mg [Xenopus laevis]|uniref:G-protein coupled receptors family 3 profile domain-containing protein n=1 Tax=Xenopus laevis TaxID=8355 RepID=A0A974DT05_XENLA|nr:hypothetical protein XELAEV_18008690mg [Xenopus laevis]